MTPRNRAGPRSHPLASLKRNYLLNLLLSGINVAFPLASIAYASRMLGPEALGRFYFANALAAYFAMLASLGLSIYGAREIAKRRDDPLALGEAISGFFTLNLVSTGLMLAAYACLVSGLPAFAGERGLLLILAAGVAANAFSVEYLYVGLEEYPNIAWRAFLTKSVSLAALLACVRGPENLGAFAAISVAGPAAHGLLGLLGIRKRARLRLSFRGMRAHAAPLAAIAANLALVLVYNNLDSVLLGWLSGTHSVSLYNAGVRLDRILMAVISTAGVALVPRFAYLLGRGHSAEAAGLAAKSLSVMCFLACPAVAFVLAAAPELSRCVFGPGFGGAVLPMRICAPLVLITGFTNFLGLQILFPRGKEWTLLAAVALAAATDVGLVLALAPGHAEAGAAWALLAAETVVLIVQLRAFLRMGDSAADLGLPAWRYFAAAPAAALPVLAIRGWAENPYRTLALSLAAGTVGYLGALLALRDPVTAEILRWAGIKSRRPRGTAPDAPPRIDPR